MPNTLSSVGLAPSTVAGPFGISSVRVPPEEISARPNAEP
jgi:hypothetical protein